MASMLGRLAGIVAPKAAASYYADPTVSTHGVVLSCWRFVKLTFQFQSNGVLWLSLGGILVSIVFLIPLPVETKGRQAF